MKIYDLVIPEETGEGENKKTYWPKVGVMFVDGEKMNIKLTMFPELHVKAFERKPKEKTDNSPF
jgi:hypothetical protein